MRWHKEGKRDSEDLDIKSHPTDTEAWEALDRFDPEFASDTRSVHLGLSTDGFHPHNEASSQYSCCLVFVMPYNLLPNKCLKQGFVFYDRTTSGRGSSLGSTGAILGEPRTQSTHISTIPYFEVQVELITT
jgi:hypothetical protein